MYLLSALAFPVASTAKVTPTATAVATVTRVATRTPTPPSTPTVAATVTRVATRTPTPAPTPTATPTEHNCDYVVIEGPYKGVTFPATIGTHIAPDCPEEVWYATGDPEKKWKARLIGSY